MSQEENGLQEKAPVVVSGEKQIDIAAIKEFIFKNNGGAIILCAALSAVFMNLGLFSLFYLVPVGYAVIVYKSSRLTFLSLAVIHGAICLTIGLMFNRLNTIWMEFVYFTILFMGFIWIMDSRFINLTGIRTLYRLILAAVISSAAFFIFIMNERSGFEMMLGDIARMISSTVIASTEADAARHSYLQQMLSPERVLETARLILARGGAVFSMIFVFYFNRHIANIIVMIRKKRINEDGGLKTFFAPVNTIWALSGSLAFILLARQIRVEMFQLIAWNLFVVCAIIFLAQGVGIVMHWLHGRPPSTRLIFNVLLIFLLISPLSTVVFTLVLLLGIAENWVAFRRPKERQISTPEM